MEFFKVVSVNDARELIQNEFGNYQMGSEEVSLVQAQGRQLSEDVVSDINVPEFDRSTVDGYAIQVEDSHGATESIPSILEVLGEVLMGETPNYEVKTGQAVYVPTGGMMPMGATGMIMIENTEKMDQETVLLFKPISKGENTATAATRCAATAPAKGCSMRCACRRGTTCCACSCHGAPRRRCPPRCG